MLTMSLSIFAQKFCYVDSDYILNQMPEYKTAQSKLDDIAAQWQNEIQDRYQGIDDMYKAYQADQVLLTEEQRKKREDAIISKEKELKDYQKQKFGYEGELFKKRQELIKPIQDKIYAEIQKLAKQRAYDFIFDKSSGTVMLFANEEFDQSSIILKSLGVKVKE